MRVDITVQEFTEGELAPSAKGQTSKERYHRSVAKARNVFIDFQGGISSRPGTHFLDYIQHDDKAVKLAKFDFSPDVSSTYLLVFGDYYLRFMQDGAYVTEAGQAASAITKANPGVVSITAHGYSNGDWVIAGEIVGMDQMDYRLCEVSAVTAHTFELLDQFGAAIDTTAYDTFTSGSFYRIYTVATPYPAADLTGLKVRQKRNLLSLVHLDYTPRDLVRIGHTNWTLTEAVFGTGLASPGSPVAAPSAVGTSGVAFVVTAVNFDGDESLASAYGITRLSTLYNTTADTVKFSWTAVAGAKYYKIYRTLILQTGAQISRGADVGFVGISYGTEFIDDSLTPDFTRTPPLYKNPFKGGEIEAISITAGGAGHDDTSTVAVSGGGGSGFIGYPVVASGIVTGIRVINPGFGYVSPTVSFAGAGTGATATATASETSGRNPSAVTIHQQRRVFAATLQEPLTIWGSRPAAQNNFDYSLAQHDNDSWEHELDTNRVAPIRHLLSTRAGLLAFTQEEIIQLSGGANGITPTNALAEPESYTGADKIPPVRIDTDIVYMEGKGTTVRLLTYNDYSKVYAGDDISAASSHFFPPSKEIENWAWAQDPHKLLLAQRNDGHMLAMTFISEREIRAWTEWTTKGLFEDVISLQEGTRDKHYTVVKRYINGRWTKFIERFDSREFEDVEDAWCVDCGKELPLTYPAADITFASATGVNVQILASASVFGAASVGDIIRAGGGRAKITVLDSATEVHVDWVKNATAVLPEDDNFPLPQLAGDWSLDTPINSITGLSHLEGQTVSVLADGNVILGLTVANGAITLPGLFTRVIVGLKFTYKINTLPPSSYQFMIDGKIKRVIDMQLQLRKTRGLETGITETNLYAMKERTNEGYNEATNLLNGVYTVTVNGNFSREGGLWLASSAPLPATILSYTMQLEVEDASR